MASFLLARLNPELSRAVCCVSIRYMCRPLSPSFSLSYEVKASSATPAKLHVNINCPAVLTKGIANKCFADEGALFLSSKCSSSNFSQVRPHWFFNSSLFTSALRWVAQFSEHSAIKFLQATFQLFRSNQGNPPGALSCPCMLFSSISLGLSEPSLSNSSLKPPPPMDGLLLPPVSFSSTSLLYSEP